ncbi:SRPBCC family protein [Natrialba sp. INN-245]|uniref:SRPBCC family protein n=1 Tax=Natrialba sp. INN-245 TaxID=2690967 RepID=UPI0013126D38|nr:SRPBCC family protein [Natrialba sp. INN-245]MWV39871.1 SRPBCC family protein [Natrialba sp. INN-245]
MRDVSVSGFIQETPGVLRRHLDPATVVEAEGSFTPSSVDEREEETIVVASGPGLEFPLRFENRDDEIVYTQASEDGPFARMETRIEFDRENEGTRVTIHSSVELAAPIPFGDRIAAWKRRRELSRMLEAVTRDLE